MQVNEHGRRYPLLPCAFACSPGAADADAQSWAPGVQSAVLRVIEHPHA